MKKYSDFRIKKKLEFKFSDHFDKKSIHSESHTNSARQKRTREIYKEAVREYTLNISIISNFNIFLVCSIFATLGIALRHVI
jgi:hypothetical protein